MGTFTLICFIAYGVNHEVLFREGTTNCILILHTSVAADRRIPVNPTLRGLRK